MNLEFNLYRTACFLCPFILLSFFSCTHEPELAGLEPVCYDTQVLPILQISCAMSGCHDGTEEDFAVTDYQSVLRSVNPGDPRGSELYKVISAINSEHFMPPDKPLTKLQRSIIQVWISQGANETICKPNAGDIQQ
jgi:hypothetical protein